MKKQKAKTKSRNKKKKSKSKKRNEKTENKKKKRKSITCENAVSQTQYGSWTLRVMGSW